MRSVGLLAVVIGTLVLASACSDGAGTTPPENEAPEAAFTEVCTNLTCVFTDASTDPNGNSDITGRTWIFGDGSPGMAGATATHVYGSENTYTVVLQVTDNAGLTSDATKEIAVTAPENQAPVAGFTYVATGTSVAFTNTSTDADGTITYLWNFGEPASGENESTLEHPTHEYAVTGPTTFTVTLTVTDDDGSTDAETQTITVTPTAPVNPPSAGFTPSCTLAACTFVSTSSDVAPGTIVSYAWTFGDGGNAAVSNPSHTYNVTTPTEFTVTLTVTDNDGYSNVATRTIVVDPVAPVLPPTARFSYSCIKTDCTFTSTSFDHLGRVKGQVWDLGDGTTSTELSLSHSYAVTQATQFTVTLTVTDNDDNTNVTSQIVPIDPAAANLPPTANFTIWCHGESCIFTSTSTDPAPGAIVTYAWTFGDGGTEDWRRPSHVFNVTSRTTFPVTLTVTDNEGLTAVVTKDVTVTPLPPAVQGCTTAGKIVECVLDIPAAATLKVTLLGINCDLAQRISTPPPVGDQLFIAVCSKTVGDAIGIFGGRLDDAWVYQAGTQARIWFTQGNSTRALNPPQGRVEGSFPDWTISIEDGDHPGAAGEPDFSDVVMGVHATAR